MLGCVISPEVIKYIDFVMLKKFGNSVSNAFNEGRLMFPYRVPCSKGFIDYYYVNWVYPAKKAFMQHPIEFIITEAFSRHNKSIEDEDVKAKIKNTVDFVKYSLEYIEVQQQKVTSYPLHFYCNNIENQLFAIYPSFSTRQCSYYNVSLI